MTLTLTVPPRADADRLTGLPVAVIGAGPVGLAAAAHLLEQGLPVVVYEAGDQVGTSVRAWGHTRLFSPWRYVIDDAARRLLEPTGWTEPRRSSLPTGHDLVALYLEPLAQTPELAPVMRYGVRVDACPGRHGPHPLHRPRRHPVPPPPPHGRRRRGRHRPRRHRHFRHLHVPEPRSPPPASPPPRTSATGSCTRCPTSSV